MLHNPTHTTGLAHDLHRRGPRSGPDLTHKRAHTSAPYGLLVPHHQPPNTAIPTKTHTIPPTTHQGVTSQEDRHQLRTRNGPEIMAALRNLTIRPHPPGPRRPSRHRLHHQIPATTTKTRHQAHHPTNHLTRPCRPPGNNVEPGKRSAVPTAMVRTALVGRVQESKLRGFFPLRARRSLMRSPTVVSHQWRLAGSAGAASPSAFSMAVASASSALCAAFSAVAS